MKTSQHRRLGRAGFSLVELLVAMAIGLVVTLAITRVMIGFDSSKRTSTALSDTNQSGNYTIDVLDRSIRQAGTGYVQRLNSLFGCRLNVTRASLPQPVVLPPPTAFQAPFANASLMRRLAPVLIEQDAADVSPTDIRGDVITTMSGAGGKSEMPQPVGAGSIVTTPVPGLALPNTLDYLANDLVLIADPTLPGGCMIQQVRQTTSTSLQFGGDYYSPTGTTMGLADFSISPSSTAVAAHLGNVTRNNPPQFHMFGVGDGATLFRLDLLQSGSTDENLPQPISDNVVEMRALYGLDTDFDPLHTVNAWQSPGVSPFRYADLTDGSATALLNMKQIAAIRLGLVLRTPLQEKEAVVAPVPMLFAGVTDALGNSMVRTRTVSSADQSDRFRYRTIELIIPVRNMLYATLP